MPQSTVFPAFITDEYRPGNGFASFQRDAEAAAAAARRTFETSFSEIQSIATRALALPRNQGGSLDLGVGQYRQAAEAANAQAIALREVATAAERAARANGDASETTRLYVQAARAAAIEAENSARAANDQAVAMERVQTELNQTASRTSLVIASHGRLSDAQNRVTYSSRAQQFAMVQVGQQLQDVAIQAQQGVNPLVIFAQQGSQLGFAMSQLEGKLGSIGRFLAGGWGSAIFLAVAAVQVLARALDHVQEASEAAKHAAEEFANAQNDISTFFDRSSGKIREQNALLVENAILLRQARIDEIRQQSGGLTPAQLGAIYQQSPSIARAHGIDPRTLRTAQDWIASTINAIVNETPRLQAEIRSLGSGHLDQSLRTDRATRQREDHRPQQADASLEQIQRINEQWNAQPPLVDRAVQAVRELQHILIEAARLKLPHFAEMAVGAQQAEQAIREGLVRQIAEGFTEAPKLIQRATTAIEQLNAAAEHFPQMAPQIAAAGQAVENTLLRPYRDVLENMVLQADQQHLINQGRDGEAQALALIRGLEQQLGDIGEERRRTIIAGSIALQEQARQYEIVRQRQQSYLTAISSVRTSVENLFAHPGDTGSFLSGITHAFSQLNAETLTERLFGPIFRKMEDQSTGRDRVRNENVSFAEAIGNMRAEITNLRSTEEQHRQSLDQVIGSLGNFRGALDTAAAAVRGHGVAGGSDLAIWDNAGSGPGWRNAAPTGRLPVSGTITNTYAQHLARGSHGLDIAASTGTAIQAPAAGQVLVVDSTGAGRSGRYIVIDNGGGVTSSYSHLSRIDVAQGQFVNPGDIIGAVGQTGHATGPHLHYRVKVNGQDVDPQTYQFTQQAAASTQAVAHLGTGLTDLNTVINGLTDNLNPAAQALTDTGKAVADTVAQVRGAANDNAQPGGIVVTAQRDPTANLDPRQFARTMMNEFSRKSFGEEFGTRAGNAMANALQGAIFGDQVGSILHAGGINLPNGLAQGLGALAGQIPGFGNAVQGISSAMPFIGAAVSVNHAIGNLLGNNQIKNGGLLNLIIGPFLTALFGSAKRGSATITSVDGTPTTRGNDSSRISTASSLATGVQAAIQHIADALGGTIGSFSGSIGVRKDKYVVDPTGRGRTKGSGTLSFSNEADAVAALLHDAIMDGAVQGLRAGSLALLQHAKDIDTGIAKALKFEGVFTDLKARLDPVGAALDTLNKKFADLKTIFAEAGASAEDYAKLEQEYGLERADAVKQAGEQMTSALKSLLDDLTTNNSALSLRDRLASAHAAYDPLAARVAAGDTTVNYDDFAAAARTLLDIERQIDGSTSAYFDLLAQVTDLTKSALDRQNALIDAASSADTPFTAAVSAGADQTVSALDKLGNLLVDQLGGQLSAVNDNMATMIGLLAAQSGGGGGGGAFSNIANF